MQKAQVQLVSCLLSLFLLLLAVHVREGMHGRACSESMAVQDGKVKNTPWGSSFKKAPEILHGAS